MELPNNTYTREKNHWFFGAYANMARHNVFLILNDIANKIGLTTPEEKDESWEKSRIKIFFDPVNANERRPDITQKCLAELYRHFPFLKALSIKLNATETNPEAYFEILKNFFENLEKIRNFYTHAYHKEQQYENESFLQMNYIFDDAVSLVSERFSLSEEDIEHLQRKKGYDKVTKTQKKNPLFMYSFMDKDGLTEKGIAFFICLFLEKEYAALFLKKLKGFKRSEKKSEKATIEVYTVYGCKLPQQKLESNNDKQSLLLDILNELQRCPIELYETLNPQNKDKFITKFDTSNNTVNANEVDDSIEMETSLIRKKDRFPYFALRYIDEKKLFKTLRFHIDLGNYVYKTYPKQLNGHKFIRHWERKLLSFGRLQEYNSDKLPKEWILLKKNPEDINDDVSAPYWINTRPHYHFNGKSIGIKNMKDYSETLWANLIENEKPTGLAPDYYLSTDELTGLIFYNFLSEKLNSNLSAEDLIIKTVNNFKEFFGKIKNGELKPFPDTAITNEYSGAYGATYIPKEGFEIEYENRKMQLEKLLLPYNIKPHQIPDKIRNYLMKIEPIDVMARMEFIVNTLLNETENLIDKLQPSLIFKPKTKEKRKRQRIAHLKAGDTADFLARDMIFLQPYLKDENNKISGKPNSDEFQLLQASLAFFRRDKKELPSVFKLCKLIDSKNPHPFLSKINLDKCDDSRSFYKFYLSERKKFLAQLLKDKNFEKYQYFIGNEYIGIKNEDYFKKLADKFINEIPINLPRGLFKDGINDLIKKFGNDELKKLIENNNHNTVYIISEYFKLNSDDSQPFYNLPRNYKVIDKVYDNRITAKDKFKPLTKVYKTKEEQAKLALILKEKSTSSDEDKIIYNKYRKFVINHEKVIRHFETSDKVLFLICKSFLSEMQNELKNTIVEKMYLKNIMPDNPKSILNESLKFEFSIYSKTIEHTFKIKDYGTIRRYLKDRRIKGLLEYYSNDTLQFDELKNQLRVYEQNRLKIFEAIYNFEKDCKNFETIDNFIKQELSTKGYVNHVKLLKEYFKLNSIDNATHKIDTIIEIRNTFSHNKYPEKSKCADIITEENIPFATQLANWVVDKYNFKPVAIKN